jgi:hypothetical protein
MTGMLPPDAGPSVMGIAATAVIISTTIIITGP